MAQRGKGRARTFFDDADYVLYRDLLGEHCAMAGVDIWSWVPMPNQVHLIFTPGDPDGLRRALSAVHRRYAGHTHARLKRTGHFWQGRFGCVAMGEAHLGAALRYVALNPVRASLAARAVDWPWSSVHAHLGRIDDGITAHEPVISRYPDFAGLLAVGEDEERVTRLRKAEQVGRPIGDTAFLDRLEREASRSLRPGPKPR